MPVLFRHRKEGAAVKRVCRNIEELGRIVGSAAAVMLFSKPREAKLRDVRRGGYVTITFNNEGHAIVVATEKQS